MLHHSFFNSTNYNLFKKCQFMKKTKGFYKIKHNQTESNVIDYI